MTRKELEDMIEEGMPVEEVEQHLLASLIYDYSDELLRDREYFNTANCDEMRRRRTRYKEVISAKAEKGIKNNISEAKLIEMYHDKDEKYYKLALGRIGTRFFYDLPGKELEKHKQWKREIQRSLCRPFKEESTGEKVCKLIENEFGVKGADVREYLYTALDYVEKMVEESRQVSTISET